MNHIRLNASQVCHIGDVAEILAKAEAQCRAVADRDLARIPLYLVRQSTRPADYFAGEHHYAFTTPSLDSYVAPCISNLRGRRPCMVVNDLRREMDELNAEARRLDEQCRIQADRATYMEEKARSEHRRAERELMLGDTEARREVAQRYRKEAESARRDAKRLEKTRADLDKRPEQLEQRMRQA